jgi:gliding motility-associated-like protein
MKKLYFLLIFFFSFCQTFATHTKGGWMYYEYLGRGISDPTKLRYRVGLNFYMDCNSGVFESTFFFSIFAGGQPHTLLDEVAVPVIQDNNINNCNSTSCYPCISNPPPICYRVIKYETIIELDPSPTGYIITKQRCCRINNIANIVAPSNAIGATYTIKIPGFDQLVNNAHVNNSPLFQFNDTTIVCANNFFSIDFAATDADSLVYSFCDAFTGGSQGNPIPSPASTPPYTTIPYQFPFSGGSPMGPNVTIDPKTGIISGIAPNSGEYVITICVKEYRNGIAFAETRKELHLNVTPCNPVVATLDPTFLTCGDLNLSFSNQTDGPAIQNWFWTFGDPSTGSNDTSFLQFPTHAFSAAGVYTVKLVVNYGLPCIDSTEQEVSVYPGFFPGFQSTAPYCTGVPIQFGDTTRTNHGVVDYWSWNFGDPATLADTSHAQNPTYTYNSPGTYTIKLISGNSLGCRDSIEHQVTILPSPVLNLLSLDTTYCRLDSLQLNATGTGNFSWTPNTNIIGANTANPTVFPTVPTQYIVSLESQGCISRDTVNLNPVNNVTNAITALPAAICAEDTLRLTGSSNKTNNLSWQWSPPTRTATPNAQTTLAWPDVSTTYTLQTTWGQHCIATSSVNIPVTPLAIPRAGPDTAFCNGQTPIQLSASGGTSYSWSPATGLSNPTIANPIASPATTTTYIVNVGVNGCSKTKPDTVIVTVRNKPTISATNDTLICVIDTLQLHLTGPAGNVAWTPNYMINNIASPDPLVSPDVPTLYRVRLTDSFGCFSDDSVFVNVKAQVSLTLQPDTSICEGSSITLQGTSDGLTYSWTPAATLSNPSILNPVATPATTTTYTVVADIGNCSTQRSVTVKVVPAPDADAGPDQTICIGFDTQLTASGGSSYQWAPPLFLNNPVIASPTVIQPNRPIQYIVTVTDTLGCPTAVKDTILVTVIQALNVNAGPADTSVVEDEPLQLQGTGALTYTWTPSTWLSATNISNPVSLPQDSIRYYLTGMDANGCIGTDSIDVYVFRVEEDLYVPTAFTPNGDGLNDTFKPILLGMKSISYFRVYNRFGELVFSTSQVDHGWDGIYKGKPQDTATFVWMVAGVTYKGQLKKKKGYVVLIR